jgi:hypothetical protein
MKKAFLTSAMFMLMMVLTSFQVDSEIGGENQSKPKTKGVNIFLGEFDNQIKPMTPKLELNSLKQDNQVKPVFKELTYDIGGGDNQSKPKRGLDSLT